MSETGNFCSIYGVIQTMRIRPKSKCFRKSAMLSLSFLLAACVNDTGTSALTNTSIQTKLDTHEQRHVASKCNSADRLKSSNLASEALNAKYTTLGSAETALAPQQKSEIESKLQAKGTQLGALDQDLNTQCVSWSKCEYLASTDKRSCSSQKHKYLDADKQMVKFYKQVTAIKVN